MKKVKILVTGAGAVLGQGIIKSLLNSSLDLEIVAVDPSPLAVGLYWTDKKYLIPLAKAPNYLESICKILELERPDMVMVGTDVELKTFAKNRDFLEKNYATKVLVSPSNVIAIADDKYLTYKFLLEGSLPAPISCLPGNELELIEKTGFPLIVKPRVGARSIGVSKVNNHKELDFALQNCENPIIQECIGTDDTEFTAGALCFDDVCRATIVMKRDLRDGNTYRAYTGAYDHLSEQIENMTNILKPYGPVNYQFREVNGVAKVFEINGRFSGTTPFRAKAGFNEVEMCIRHIVLGEKVAQPQIEELVLLRYLDEISLKKSDLLESTT